MRRFNGSTWINFVVLIVVNLLWAAQYPAYKVAGDHMGAASLNFWTLLLAVLLLLPFRLRETWKQKSCQSNIQWKTVREFLILGLLGIVPPTVMLSWGISRSSASNAAILSLTIPVLMTSLAVVMLGERITAIRVVSLLLGLLGTLLVSASDLARASFSRALLMGNLIIFIAGLGSAFYNTYSKDLLSRYSELEVLIYSYTSGAAACALISVLTETRPFYHVTGYPGSAWLAVFVLGAFSWGLAMVLWMWVLSRLEVGQVSASIYLLPLFGLLLSVVTVHEHIRLAQILGGALAVTGTATLTFYENRRPCQTASQ